MNKKFFYIVVEVDGQKYFIDRNMELTDNFETVLQFSQREYAEEFIECHDLKGKMPKVLSVQ